jgi:hypothetical protein
MSGINKHSFAAWILGIALGVTTSGFVYAGTVTNPDFASGNTLDAAHMNNIKSAVNDNNTRLGTAETNITTLQTGVGACAGNPAVPGDTMVRVGSLCVDKYEANIAAGVARSIVAVAPSGATWAEAADACAKAGKRLPTNAEWQMAAAGTPENDGALCNKSGTAANTNAHPSCLSSYAVVNMAGNVAEWVADWDSNAASNTILSASIGIVRGNDASDTTISAQSYRGGQALNVADPFAAIPYGFRCVR